MTTPFDALQRRIATMTATMEKARGDELAQARAELAEAKHWRAAYEELLQVGIADIGAEPTIEKLRVDMSRFLRTAQGDTLERFALLLRDANVALDARIESRPEMLDDADVPERVARFLDERAGWLLSLRHKHPDWYDEGDLARHNEAAQTCCDIADELRTGVWKSGVEDQRRDRRAALDQHHFGC